MSSKRWSAVPPLGRDVVVAAAIVVLGALWAAGSGYRVDLVMLVVTYGMVALGLYTHFILGGRLSIAYNAYLAIGAYSVAWVATRSELPMVVGILAGVVISAGVAFVLGVITGRLSGFYLAAVTLLFGDAFQSWLVDADGLTGGAGGIGGVPALTIFGATFDRHQVAIVGLVVLCATATGLSALRRAPLGVAIRAGRESPAGLAAIGLSPVVTGWIALVIGAMFGSLGGSMFVISNRAILPESLTLSVVLLAIFMPLLGGRQSPWGAVIGAALVVQFTFNLTWFKDTGSLMFAVAVIVVLVFAPNGLLGLVPTVRGLLASVTRRGATSPSASPESAT